MGIEDELIHFPNDVRHHIPSLHPPALNPQHPALFPKPCFLYAPASLTCIHQTYILQPQI
jgi:hypothetical protein